MSLNDFLEKINKDLMARDFVRQEIQTTMRKATRLSKQAIFLVHKNKIDQGSKALAEAKELLGELERLSGNHHDLRYMGIVDTAFEEYSEASILLSLVKEGRFVGFEEIKAPMVPYVLGLADLIGELRRQALDFLRKAETHKAEESLELMETVYSELMKLDEFQFLIPGFRRKLDVARRVIEETRGDVTVEVRRSQLEDSLMNLRKVLQTGEKE